MNSEVAAGLIVAPVAGQAEGYDREHAGKNLETPCVVKTVISFIAQLGYLEVKVGSDNEPVIKKIVAKIAGTLREGKG